MVANDNIGDMAQASGQNQESQNENSIDPEVFKELVEIGLHEQMTNETPSQLIKDNPENFRITDKDLESLSAEETELEKEIYSTPLDFLSNDFDEGFDEMLPKSSHEVETELDISQLFYVDSTEETQARNVQASSQLQANSQQELAEAEKLMQFFVEYVDIGSNPTMSIPNKNTQNEQTNRKPEDGPKNKEQGQNNANFTVNYCHAQIMNLNSFAMNCQRNLQKLLPKINQPRAQNKPYIIPNMAAKVSQNEPIFYTPKTKEEVFHAIAKVTCYLQEEAARSRRASRRRRPHCAKHAKQSYPSKPKVPLDVQMYIHIGILPWDMKNKQGPPADDIQCQIRIPPDIKAAILRYRKWYPTMQDKMYCFEKHSMFLFDVELFGCWECIRKYYNEIYKWANRQGFVLRASRS